LLSFNTSICQKESIITMRQICVEKNSAAKDLVDQFNQAADKRKLEVAI
jgi:hypothetical protein